MDTVQIISLVVIFFSLGLCIDMMIKCSKYRLYLVPVLVYLLHVGTFYTLRLLVLNFGLFPDYLLYFSFTDWSSIVRLQGVTTILFYLIIIGKYDVKFFKLVKEWGVSKNLWKTG